MFPGRSNNFGQSAASTKISNSSLASSKTRRDNFFVYAYKKIWAMLTAVWGKTRKGMWLVSTGFILLVLPFSFAYILEYQKEAARIMQAQM